MGVLCLPGALAGDPALPHQLSLPPGLQCNASVDLIGTCWPRSPAGQLVVRPCPAFFYGVRYNTTSKGRVGGQSGWDEVGDDRSIPVWVQPTPARDQLCIPLSVLAPTTSLEDSVTVI